MERFAHHGGDSDLAGADPEARRHDQTPVFYRLAAVLFVGGGLAAVPPDLLHSPGHPAAILLLPLLAVLSGAVCWLVADRAPAAGLHLVAIAATCQIALTVALADEVFAIYYVFVAIFVAYVFDERRMIAAHLGLVVLAALAPVVYEPDSARSLAIRTLILVPTLAIACVMVTYLREHLVASEERYRTLSERDPLTGIGNYRMLVNRVPRELLRHGRYGHRLGLIAIDLDDFKQINDALGHQRGDLVLREVAEGLSDCVRAGDILVRQGGDEFAVIAPETDPEDTRLLGERLRARVATIAIGERTIGASIGTAQFPDDGETLESLLRVADERLRGSKGGPRVRSGRRPASAAVSPATAEAS